MHRGTCLVSFQHVSHTNGKSGPFPSYPDGYVPASDFPFAMVLYRSISFGSIPTRYTQLSSKVLTTGGIISSNAFPTFVHCDLSCTVPAVSSILRPDLRLHHTTIREADVLRADGHTNEHHGIYSIGLPVSNQFP